MPAAPADLFQPVRQAGKAPDAGDDLRIVEPDGTAGGDRRDDVLRVVRAAQRGKPADIEESLRHAALGRKNLGTGGIDAVEQPPLHRHADDAAPGARDPLGDRRAPFVIDRDDRRRGRRDEPLLDAGVCRHGAMPVEMVGRDVEEHADGRIERRREIDLEGRALDDVRAPDLGRRQRQDRRADVAAKRDVALRLLEDVRDERGGGRLAVGAGDGDERPDLPCRRDLATLAAEQFDIADDLDAGVPGAHHRPRGLRVGERHARREHQRGETFPVGGAEVADRDLLLPRRFDRGGAVVPGRDLRLAGDERGGGGDAAAAEAEDRDVLSGEGGDRDHARFTGASGSTGR